MIILKMAKYQLAHWLRKQCSNSKHEQIKVVKEPKGPDKLDGVN